MDNRRKTIVINKPFQYQYSLLIAALAVLLVNGFIILRVLFPVIVSCWRAPLLPNRCCANFMFKCWRRARIHT